MASIHSSPSATACHPVVSVIVPMRDAEAFVAKALASILAEKRIALEVIVIDDGSSDQSRSIVEGLGDSRIRVIDGPVRGIAAAVNAGIDCARGEFVARCDADDLYTADRLSVQAEWLTQRAEFGAICGGFRTIDPKGRTVSEMDCGQASEEISEELRSGVTRTHFCTFMVRRDALKAIGGSRSYFKTAEDIDLQLRLGHAYRVWFEPRACYAYRLHDASATHSQQSAARVFEESTARRFAAQRKATGTDDLDLGNPPSPPVGSSRPTAAREHIQGQLQGLAWKYHRSGQVGKAIATGLRACLVRPGKLSAWKSLAALVVKRARNVSDRKEGDRCA